MKAYRNFKVQTAVKRVTKVSSSCSETTSSLKNEERGRRRRRGYNRSQMRLDGTKEKLKYILNVGGLDGNSPNHLCPALMHFVSSFELAFASSPAVSLQSVPRTTFFIRADVALRRLQQLWSPVSTSLESMFQSLV